MKNLPTCILLCAGLLTLIQSAQAQVNVLANRYDNARTGANLQETVLNTANVNVNQFGLLYRYQVDGAMYAQPLYVSGLSIAGGTHNVVYVATMNDKVYAFDADQAGSALWVRDFTDGANGITPVPITDLVGSNGLNIVGNVGIESTPVIDLSTHTMYLVARTKENGSYFQRLHALDIVTGSEAPNSPVIISGSVTGSAPDGVNGVVTFDPRMQNQRPSLALANGVILISWASHEDMGAYHGWIMGYSASTLQQVGMLCMTPNGTQGGLWQSGRAPVIDSSGNAYYQTGNGDWDGQTNFGESILKLKVSTSGLTILDWFTPDDVTSLNAGDVDLGSTGPMLIPGTDILVGGGKESVLYLVHSTNLGHFASGNNQIIQSIFVNGGEMKGGPAFWDGPAGPLVYIWPQSDFLKAFHFNGTTLDSGVFAQGAFLSPGSPGGALTVSASGNSAGTGIVWAMLSTNADGDHGNVAGVLRAFDAQTLQELWDSELSPSRDRLGTLVKYVSPVVVNGKVYAVTYDNTLAVYGLLQGVTTTPDFTMAASNLTIGAGGIGNDFVSVGFLNGFAGTVNLSVSGLPAGATANFNPASISQAGTSTLQISTSSTTASGIYPLTITGTSGSLTHSVSAQLTVTSTSVSAAAISVDFVGLDTPMQASEVAGVAAKANWNSAAGAASTQPLSLRDENGNTTSASITWTSDNTWQTNISDAAGNARMMKGYLDTGKGNPTVVTVTGLPASASGYNVYVYTDGDNPGATRMGLYQISGSGLPATTITATDSASKNFAGSFQQASGGSAGNYVMFTIQATGFTLTATPGTTTDSYPRAPINGIQIVPLPAPDFTVAASSVSVNAGGSANSSVSVGFLNGFAGTVNLSVSGLPAGATANFNPASISQAGTSTLQISTSSTTASGVYPLTITGTSGSLTHSVSAQLTVTSTSVSAAAISVDFVGLDTPMQASEVAGVAAKANWNSAAGAASTQPLSLRDENGNTTSASITWTSDNTWQTNISDAAGNARMMKGYLDTGKGNPTVVTVTGLPASASGYNVYVYTDGDNPGATRTGIYQISGSGLPATTITATDSASKNFAGSFQQASGGSAGNYVMFTIQATGFTLTATPGTTTDSYPRAPINGIQIVPLPAPDFTVAASSVSVNAGGSANSSVSVGFLNGFAGTVNLSVSGLPAGATANFNPASISQAGTSTLQISTSSTTASGVYPLTITGTSGSLTHSVSAQLTVTGTSVSAAAISVDFVGLDTPMQASEVAGVAAKANWNSAAGAASTQPLSLRDENGNTTSASITWTSDNTWQTNISDAAGNARMMKGYLDTGKGNPTVVTVTGLPASASGYNVYVYTDGDNPGATRTGIYQISGSGLPATTITATDSASKNFAGTFRQASGGSAGNYVMFTIQATGFTLTATPGTTTDSYPRAPINGIQIVPVQNN